MLPREAVSDKKVGQLVETLGKDVPSGREYDSKHKKFTDFT